MRFCADQINAERKQYHPTGQYVFAHKYDWENDFCSVTMIWTKKTSAVADWLSWILRSFRIEHTNQILVENFRQATKYPDFLLFERLRTWS